jgi:hypothetical protein
MHGALNCRFYCGRMKTQLPHRPRTIHEHLVPCHTHTFQRNARLASKHRGEEIFRIPCGERHGVRHLYSRRALAGRGRYQAEEFL